MKIDVPKVVREIAESLEGAGYEAYLVGGCVRDLLLRREPKDWDVATNAAPEAVQKIFPESVYENAFGTVGVKTESDEENLKIVEVTTFRIEGRYTDKRHPDSIVFAKSIKEDLARRDFTINAIAISLKSQIPNSKFQINSKPKTQNSKLTIIDPYGGRDDLKAKIVRAVGNPKERFNEDALRLMRAVRFAAELGFEIEKETGRAIKNDAGLLEMIAKERIRDELVKIVMAPGAADGIIKLEDYGLLKFVMPELREGIGCGQNLHHIYTVFEHNIRALNYTAEKGYPLHIRLVALLHDVGKPRTKRGEGKYSTFYNHEVVGAKMTAKVMDRIHFSKELTEKVSHLVRSHLFYYNVGEVTAAGVRRFLARVGSENVPDLIKVREADRIGSGVPKAIPYKIRHLLFMIDKVKNDPISPKMVKINGNDVMKILGLSPGPKIGWILNILLEEVLDDPEKNKKSHLEERARELGAMKDKELIVLAEKAETKKEEFESGVEKEIKKKYHVE